MQSIDGPPEGNLILGNQPLSHFLLHGYQCESLACLEPTYPRKHDGHFVGGWRFLLLH